MTAHQRIDEATLRLARGLQGLVAEELAAQRRAEAARARAERIDAEIMAACRAVAAATDALAQAQFAGASELPARRRLERAAKGLADAMRRHGRAG